MVFPLYDDNPFKRARMPFATWGLIGVNLFVFMANVGATQEQQQFLLMDYGVVPAFVTTSLHAHALRPELTLVTGMFLHGGWGHILGNMIYLWVFGDDIEGTLGSLRFLVFYLLVGIAASLAFIALNPYSGVPLVGASGAIAGVLAAYLMLRPCAKVTVFVFRVVVRVCAFWVIGGWIVLQLVSLPGQQQDGVAYMAHVGGFAAGALLFLVMRPAGTRLFECMKAPAGEALSGMDRNTLT